MRAAYQTNRNYNWASSGINPLTHTFGIRGSGNIDQVAGAMQTDTTTHLVTTAVDRADHGSIIPDPDPLDPRPRLMERTMVSSQLRPKPDPAQLPPAGVVSKASEFNIGDTFAGMGTMTSFDRDYLTVPREYHREELLTHGISTKPNAFPNPLHGPGRYVALGLSDEDFAMLRDKEHIVPVMVSALDLSDEEAGAIFDRCAERLGRDKISVSEFHEAFKAGE
jgi:hypothetical protein